MSISGNRIIRKHYILVRVNVDQTRSIKYKHEALNTNTKH